MKKAKRKGEDIMKKGWKKLVTAGSALAMATSIVGCGSSESAADSGSKAASTSTNASPVEITYSAGKDVTPATQKLIETFEKEHPNIKVNFREMPADTGQQHDQYVTMFNAGSSDVDVLAMDVIWPAEFAQAGYLQPLDDFIAKDHVNLDDYIKGAVDAASFNGKQWALPRFIDTGLLFYRKDIVQNPPKTWDELIADAQKYKGQAGTKYGYLAQAKQYEGLVCDAIEFIASYGGKVIDDKGNITINSPQTIKGLEEMKKVIGSNFVPSNITTYMETETDNSFISGDSVFARNWPYQFAEGQDATKSKIVGKVGVAPLPAGDAGSAAALGGWMAAINKNSKHKQEAWEFLKFLESPEGEKIAALYGGSAPTLKALYDDPDIKSKNPIFADPGFVKGISAAVPRPVSPVYPKLSDIMQTEISKFLANKETASEAVKVMEDKMKEAIK
jgi:multiple sugar transport system substrate-binding protein